MRLLLPLLAIAALAGCPASDNQVAVLRPELALSPPGPIAFGPSGVPLTATYDLLVTNAGKADLEVSLRFDPKVPEFGLATDRSAVVAPGDTWTVPVTFTPPTYLDYATELVVTSNDEELPEVRIPVTGTGVYVALPDIAVEPAVLDFGTVDAGRLGQNFVNVSNLGDAPLTLGEVTLEGDPSFTLLSNPSNAVIAPGDSLPVLVQYLPTDENGDQATLHLPSSDPDEALFDAIVLGNGGTGFQLPVALIDCPGTSAPPTYVALDGTGSYDPNNQLPLTYFWYLTLLPTGSEGALTAASGPSVDLFTDIAGDYRVELEVINAVGVHSERATCDIAAIPADALHVELTWDDATDLDLHVAQVGYDLFELPGDANWCNDNPSWGPGGADDDPRLDLDDIAGFGPENINILSPADGDYAVRVHYFSDHQAGNGPPNTATVKVYLNGALAWTGQHLLEEDEVWDVGVAKWPAGTFNPLSQPTYTAPIRTCQ